MIYDTFAVKISSAGEGRFDVAVIDSPAGEASDTVDRMADVRDLESLRQAVSEARHVSSLGDDDRVQREGSVELRNLLEGVGRELFDSLIPGAVRPVWDESRGRAAALQRRLRLEIHLDPRDAALLPVASLPWELAFHASTGAFLGLDPANTVVRYLDLDRAAQGVGFSRPLRVLVAESRPHGVPNLDLDLEVEKLTTAWEGVPGIEIRHLASTTPGRLRAHLVSEAPQVLHFMGHGYSDPESGWGGLVLETESGAPDKLGGPEFRDLFQGIPGLDLVVLNACDTARPGSPSQPFAGAAAGLMLAGLPAVVAMQFPISDRAAMLFCEALYNTLASGRGIEEAVVEGRMAIHLGDRTSVEWITPALFLRGGKNEETHPEKDLSFENPKIEPEPAKMPREPEGQVHQTTNVRGDVGTQITIGTAGDLDLRSFE